MDGFRDQLFARSAFTLDKHGAAACGDLRNEVEHFEDLFTFADNIAVTEALL